VAYKELDEVRRCWWRWLKETTAGQRVEYFCLGGNGSMPQGWDVFHDDRLTHFLSWITPERAQWVTSLTDDQADEQGARECVFQGMVGDEIYDACVDGVGYNPAGDSFSAFTYYLAHCWAEATTYNKE
jgi:hypothetical protein